MTTPGNVWAALVTQDGWSEPDTMPKPVIEQWLRHPNKEVRGALYQFIKDPRFRVAPPLTSDEGIAYFTTYFEDCMATPAAIAEESAWILNGFDLSHDAVYWVRDFWSAPATRPKDRTRITAWLEHCLRTYPHFRPELAKAIADHLMQDGDATRKAFARWADDALLGPLFPALAKTPDKSRKKATAPRRTTSAAKPKKKRP